MNYKLLIEYDGKNYNGWQKQESLTTIQGTIEEAIFRFSGERVELIGSGRTDTGVHAIGQVANFVLKKEYPEYKVMNAINFYLYSICMERNLEWKKIVKNFKISNNLKFENFDPFSGQDIVIKSCEIVDDEFHSRFSAKYRNYEYIIFNSKFPSPLLENRAWWVREELNEKKMNEASQFLIGRKDFSSFRASKCQANSPVKTITFCRVFRDNNKVIFEIKARSFLHHMVRNIIGTLVLVGNGKISVEDFKKILDSKNRSRAGITAPACGLYLKNIEN